MEEIHHFITAASLLSAASSSLPQRQFHFVNELKNWTEARRFCREKYSDLVTISSMEDKATLVSTVDLNTTVYVDVDSKDRAWIGLFDDVHSWRWSFSDQNGEAEFRNWMSGEPNNFRGAESCGMMLETGFWNDAQCRALSKPVCSDVQGQNVSFSFINQSMTWTEAQSFCREHHTDLASIRTTSENEQIKGLVLWAGQVQVWIGLYRMSWTWVDGSEFSFPLWKSSEPDGAEDHCAAAVLSEDGKWEDWTCSWQFPFFCYGVPVSKRVVKVKLVKTSSLDLDDPTVQEDLLKQFEEKLKDNRLDGDLRLRWRKPADGKIFHKEEA